MRAKWVATILVVLIALLAFPQLAFAEESDDPEGPLSLDVTLTFDEEGEWVADLGVETSDLKPFPGLDNSISGNIKLEDQSYESLNTIFGLLGMDVALPKANPVQVQKAVDAGLQSIAVTKSYLPDGVQEIRLYANDELVLVVEASDPLLKQALAQLGLGEMEDLLLPFLTEGETSVVVYFPSAEMVPVTLEDELEVSDGKHVNVVSLGATVNDGELVSVAGFSADELADLSGALGAPLALPAIPTDLLAEFGIDHLAVSAGKDGLMLDAGDGRWLKVGWDADSRAAAADMLPAVGDFLYWNFADVPAYMAAADGLIANTGVELDLYVADTPQESSPVLSLGDTIGVELKDDGGVIVEGFDLTPLGIALDMSMIEPYAGALPVAARWAGDDTQLTLSVAGEKMPQIDINPDALPQLTSVFLSDQVPMDKLTALIEGIDFEVAVGAEGEVGEPDLDYEIAPGERARIYAVPRVVVDPEGNFGVGEPAMRVNSLLEGMGVDISQATDMAKLYALGYGDNLDELSVVVDPAAVEVSIDGETAAELKWDKEIRGNVLSLVEDYYQIPDIPLVDVIYPSWKADLLEALAGSGWGAWGLEVAIEDELPPSDLESFLGLIGILR